MSTTAFLTLMASYFYQCPLYPSSNYNTACDLQKHGVMYDFIIVGGGSAGSTLAGRLSENPNWNVLLIEAGDAPSNLTEVPAAYFLIQGTEEDWQFRTQPGNYCLGLKNEECNWPQGKALGGGSSINAMLAIKGNAQDYNRWFEAGNPGWDWNTMQLYFDRVLSTLKTTHYEADNPHRQALIKGTHELGIKLNPHGFLGYEDVNLTIYENQRFNVAKGYIVPIRNRRNLCIMTKTRVIQLLFDGDTKLKNPRVTGIKTDKNFEYFAKKEVIISAGAINSPKLLMLSGIGPKKHLESLGIAVRKDLSVGENLQDHLIISSYIIEFPNVEIHSNSSAAALEYCHVHDGPMEDVNIGEFVGWINTRNDSEFPNIQIMHVTMPTADDFSLPLVLDRLGFNNISTASILNLNQNSSMLVLFTSLLNPKSRGRILLSSTDPYKDPLIYPNYLMHEDDMEVLLEAIEYQNRLMHTDSLKHARVADFDIPNCNHLEFNTRAYWKCSIRNFATTIFHPVGTNKMGPANDSTAVCDSDLKVHGIDGLRIVDSSIMPSIVSCNTNIPTVAIAERAVDFIRQDFK